MGCCGEREKFENPENEQKWDYINLSDFRSSTCLTPLSYGVLYILLLISVAVYAVDIFTCANLLFFDKWSGQVKPVIPFEISRWIFTACIVLSLVLLVYRWWRAVRAMKSGVVAASYLDPLAVRVQCIRMGASGRGWRRFLVFAELTKGRKGAEYVALFTYFSFEAWLRICFAEGPRQVINALTLYSVMSADLVPSGKHAAKKGHSPIAQFFVNVQILANKNEEQAVILFGMLFTLIIWIFSALSLMLAVIFYVTFLWHHIRDGSLSRYCRRKIDTRLHRIVMVKVNKALQKDTRNRGRHDTKGIHPVIAQTDVKRQPTLPVLNSVSAQDIQPFSRQTTQTDKFTAAAPTPAEAVDNIPNTLLREPTVPVIMSNNQRPLPPSRSTTQSSLQSNREFRDDAPLISSAAPPGHGPHGSRRGPSRMNTNDTMNNPRGPAPIVRDPSQGNQRPYNSTAQFGPHPRQDIDYSQGTMRRPLPPHLQGRKPIPQNVLINRGVEYLAEPSRGGSNPTQEYEMHFQPPAIARNPTMPDNGDYVAFRPHASTAMSTAQPPTGFPPSANPPTRNFTQPPRRPPNNYFGPHRPPQRSGTAPIPAMPYNAPPNDAYGSGRQQTQAGPIPYRPATAGSTGYGPRRPPMPQQY